MAFLLEPRKGQIRIHTSMSSNTSYHGLKKRDIDSKSRESSAHWGTILGNQKAQDFALVGLFDESAVFYSIDPGKAT